MMSTKTNRKNERKDWSQDEFLIKITHYINPHMFWFKYESSFFSNEKFSELYANIETYLNEQEKTTRRTAHKPQIGEVVGIYYFPWNRWIRAKVDYIFQLTAGVASTYILWAIDYGIPLQIEDRFIRKLPQELAEAEINIIYFGGIADIVPVERIYNFSTSQNELVKCDKWSPYSVKAIDELINDAAFIRFISKTSCEETGQLFGNLEIITHTNQIIKPEIGLLESTHAEMVSTNEFFEILKKIGTNKLLRWQTYDGMSNIYLQDTTSLINLNKAMKIDHKPNETLDEGIQQKVGDWQERNKKSYDKIDTLKSSFKISKEKMEKSSVNNEIEYKDNEVYEIVEIDDSVSQKLKNDETISTIKIDDNEHKEEFGTFNVGGSSRLERMAIYKNRVLSPPSLHSLNIKEQRNNDVCVEESEIKNISSSQPENTIEKNRILSSPSLHSLNIKEQRNNDVCVEETEIKNISSLQPENTIEKNRILPPPSLHSLNIKEQRNNDVCIEETETKNISSSQLEDKECCGTSECNVSKSSSSNKSEPFVIVNNISILNEKRKKLAEKGTNEELKSTETKIMPHKIIAANEERNKNIVPAGFDLSKLTNKVHKINKNDKYRKSISKNKSFNVDSNYDDKKNRKNETNSKEQQNYDHQINSDNRYFSNNIKRNEFNNKRNDRGQVNEIHANERSGKHLQDYGEICVIDNNLKKHLVLVHGKQTRPIEKLENANFCEDVHRELENMRSETFKNRTDVMSEVRKKSKCEIQDSTFLMSKIVVVLEKYVARTVRLKLNRMYRIQSYTWPHLMRGCSNSAIIINSARTGKTLSYLPTICSLIKSNKDKNDIPGGVGPVGIIIVPSSVEVEKISNICHRLFQNSSNKLSIVESYGIRKAKNTSIQLLNGCDILIATPPSLTRLFADNVEYFDNKKLRHLVVDNIDLIHKKVQNDLNFILNKFLISEGNKYNLQLVITARLWQNYIYNYTKIYENTVLCIGAYIEAAFYGKSKISMKFVTKKLKNQIILDFLKKHPYTKERLIIVCNSDEDCKEVVEVLKDNSHLVKSAFSKSSAREIQNAYEWHKAPILNSGILVCTDSVLYECKVQNAQNLIHYSLPDSWSKFTFRFSVCFEYYEDFTKKKRMNKPPAVSLVLLDETNNSQLPKLIEFLQCHGYGRNISENILNLSNQIKIQREEKRIESNREFCSQLLSFGQCRTNIDCKYRHILTKYDVPENHVPVDGVVVVQVLSVISPSHYCVRILEQHSKNGIITVNSYSNNYAKFSLEFSQYFNNSNNHQTHWPININDLCVVSYLDTYYRAKVLNVKAQSTQHTNIFNVGVKFVDNGRTMSFKSSCLLVLPEKFQNYPFQAVNLRISGIVPYDFEEEWDSEATNAVQEWILNKDNVLRGNILFSLMDTIWVDKIVIQEELKDISRVVYGMNIKRRLLEKQYATSLEAVTDVIRDMAYKCGILQNIESPKDDIENENPLDNLKINSKSNIEMIEKHDCNKVENSISTNMSTNLDLNKSTKSGTSEENLNICSLTENLEKSKLDRARTRKRRTGSNEQSQIDKSEENKIKTETKSHRIRKKITERWEKLKENDFSRINVSSFYNPNQFYVQNIEDNEKFKKLYALIDSHMESEHICKITKPEIGLNCLAKLHNTYNRAKITKFFFSADNIEINLFFCDSGMRSVQSLNEIYHSTKEIVRFLPFQAIRCKLIGVQPLSNGIWTSEVCDLIYENFVDICEYLYVKPIKTRKPNLESETPYWTYKVIMYDCTGDKDVIINDEIVEKGMALYDPNTKHLLHKTFNNYCESKSYQNYDDENEKENWDHINIDRKFQFKANSSDCNGTSDEHIFDFDIQFTKENALELLNQFPPILSPTIIENLKTEIKSNINQNTLTKPEKNETTEIFEIEKAEKINVPDIQYKDDYKMESENIPRLKNLFEKPLNVNWQQSETFICLSISTSEIDDYSLHVNSESLFFEAYRNNQKNAIHINFLGTVCPELTSHEIKGLNVIVRLVKSIKGIFWPRLTWDSDKHNWLKYNYEAIKIDNEFVLIDQRNVYNFDSNNILIVDSSSSTSEDDDNASCIDVDRENDVFDPLADDF